MGEDLPPDLVKGCAARQLQTLVIWSICGVLLGCVVALLGLVALTGEVRFVIALGALSFTIGFCICALVGLWLTTWREAQRGYTTLDRWFRHLWQLEPGTGAVVRHPGDPLGPGNSRQISKQ